MLLLSFVRRGTAAIRPTPPINKPLPVVNLLPNLELITLVTKMAGKLIEEPKQIRPYIVIQSGVSVIFVQCELL